MDNNIDEIEGSQIGAALTAGFAATPYSLTGLRTFISDFKHIVSLQRSRGQDIDLFPQDENRETEVNRDFRFFVSRMQNHQKKCSQICEYGILLLSLHPK